MTQIILDFWLILRKETSWMSKIEGLKSFLLYGVSEMIHELFFLFTWVSHLRATPTSPANGRGVSSSSFFHQFNLWTSDRTVLFTQNLWEFSDQSTGKCRRLQAAGSLSERRWRSTDHPALFLWGAHSSVLLSKQTWRPAPAYIHSVSPKIHWKRKERFGRTAGPPLLPWLHPISFPWQHMWQNGFKNVAADAEALIS